MNLDAIDKTEMPRTILVVEDDDGLMKLIVKTLRKSDFNPIGVSTGAQAIEHIVANNEIILLLDQQLPDMTGRDIINSLNIRNLSVPFIVMTGQGDERLAVEMMKLGANDYLVKDIDFLDILPAALERLCKTIETEQRLIKAEEALQQSEMLLSESQKIGHIGSWKHDLLNNKLIWSDETYRIFGIEPNSIEASYDFFLEIVHPDDRIAVDTAYISSIKENKDSYEIEHRIIHKHNNEIRFVLEKCNHQRNLKGVHIQSVGIVQDITDSKKAEIALKKMEAMQSKIVANIGDVLVIIDENGINKYKSPNIEKLFGWLPEDLIGSVALNTVHPDDRESVNILIRSITPIPNATGKIECRYRCKDGNYTWIAITAINLFHDPDIQGILGNYHNITKRKQFEESLVKSESKFRTLVENIQGAVYRCNTRYPFNLEYISETILDITGYHSEVFLKKEIKSADLIHPEDKVRVSETVKKAINDNGTYEIEFRIIQKNGNIRWVSEHSKVTIDSITNKYFLDGIVMNITERKKMEYDLLSAKEKAEESDRLKTAFLQNMSHEIRTPLNSICGFSEMINNCKITNEKRKQFTDIILSSSHQLLSIVNDILTVSSLETKQEIVNIEEVSINNIIDEQQAIFIQQAKGKEVIFDTIKSLSNQQAEIYTDKPKITQVLTNLISNALKFTNNGTIQFGYTLEGQFLQFFVKDSGIGIEKNKIEIIFNRFVQADDSIRQNFGGTGLGLSICRGFIELLDGKIWVETELGKGSTFYFIIPYKPTSEPIKNTKTDMLTDDIHQKAEINTSNLKVLVAEDQEINFIYVEEVLSDLNCTILHALNGQEAVDICMANDDIDIVLMDIKMPVMDGYNAAQLIKAFRPTLPIIAQTAYALEKEVEKYSKVFDDYITKPITTEKLLKTTANYIKIKKG